MKKLVIIGGGIIGCAIAYRASFEKRYEITVLEKNESLLFCTNQSTRNSGVIHSGIYYDKNIMPLKALLCPRGNALLYDFCEKHNVPHKKTGKLIVATNDSEMIFLDYLSDIAQENGVGIERLSKIQTKRLQANVHTLESLYVPSSGVISPKILLEKLKEESEKNGVAFRCGEEVISIGNESDKFTVRSNERSFEADLLINAAGLYSDEISRLVSSDNDYTIEPARGESSAYVADREGLEVNLSIYPVPAPYFSGTGKKFAGDLSEFKLLLKKGKIKFTTGIHLSPTLDESGNISKIVSIGPAKTLFCGREDYETNLKPTGFYFERIKDFFPNLRPDEINLYKAGIMAVPGGSGDWIIEFDRKHSNCLHLIGIDSPGLSACLAIAGHALEAINMKQEK